MFAGEVAHGEQSGEALRREGIGERSPLASALDGEAEVELLRGSVIPVVEVHQRSPGLPVIYLDQGQPPALPEPHHGHGLCLEPTLTRCVQLR